MPKNFKFVSELKRDKRTDPLDVTQLKIKNVISAVYFPKLKKQDRQTAANLGI